MKSREFMIWHKSFSSDEQVTGRSGILHNNMQFYFIVIKNILSIFLYFNE